ncbi:MAG: carboxypeptidase regulatory-like domain-containing protein [Acidobacteria bacterium]|nr:carboxypeptidase regulatory-like domain-containing protein [Acidobacteriota bacterium]
MQLGGLLTGIALFLSSVLAQSTDAILSCAVTDPSGGAVASARLEATHVATGVSHNATSNESGLAVFAGLQPGLYRVTVEKAGFATFAYEDIRLEVGARLQLTLAPRIGSVADTVTVIAGADSVLGFATASVGGVLSGQQILQLPIPARNALSLVYTQAGLLGDNFAGARRAALNITLDGVNVQDQRNNNGVSSPVFTSVDRVEEIRVITAPADAELGRGSGQIQMITRSGTNEIHGSMFEFHRNTVLNANTWFNNQRGLDPFTARPLSPRNVLIRNQFGWRIGGPVRRNRTFFHFLYDAQRIRQRTSVTNTVYTATARQGLFRFYPGARNGNAEASIPVVDLTGRPLRPAAATGDLRQFSLFNLDPNRRVADPTGTVSRVLAVTPLPNNFRIGDGLNTAGYTWQRRSTNDFDVFHIKLDHHFSHHHRLSYTYNYENESESNTRYAQPFPGSPGGIIRGHDRFHMLAVTSSLRANLMNEFRAGVLRPDYRASAPWELAQNAGFLPQASGETYIPVLSQVSNIVTTDDDPVHLFSPLYQFTDSVTHVRGSHTWKAGVDVRFASSNGFNSTDVMPRVNFGTGAVAVTGINSIAGIGPNLATAQSMLNDLSGSLASVRQAINSTGGANPRFVPGHYKDRHWKRPEVSWFVKDDWKATRDLTVNIGVRWEYYGVPYDNDGLTASLVGGSPSIFGLSGTSYRDVYQPGRSAGALTRVQTVGPGSANPSAKLYNNDWNNFAPAVGLSYALPWFQRRTVFLAGYGIFYERQSLRLIDVVSGDQPGLRESVLHQTGNYMDLRSVSLPLQTQGPPLSVVPVTDRTQTARVFNDDLRTPYIQNWNASLQRELARNLVFEARYVGSKGTRLIRGVDVNERNIFENGLLDAFLVTQGGGSSPLLDRIYNGLNVAGAGVVNGTTVRGSAAARANATTAAFLAQQNVAGFADYFNTSTAFTGVRGGLLRRAGLPENFVVANPQFSSARLESNFANSTYHSLQLELIRRFSRGWTFQGNYTFSKALGEEDGDGDDLNRSYRSGRDRTLDKKLLGFHRAHVVRTSGVYELPLGPGKPFLNAGWIARVAGRWQIGNIINVFSGAPLSITSGRASFNTFNAANTPATSLVPLGRDLGSVTRRGSGVTYFANLRQVPDPSLSSITTANNLRARSTLLGVADASGRVILINALPGSPGTLPIGFFEGPGALRFDLNIVKRIRLQERWNAELRADAISALNRPNFSAPNTDINSLNFGRISATDDGNRILVVSLRLNF